MKEVLVKGKYSEATILNEVLDSKLLDQVNNLCNNKCTENTEIYFMPDAHPGKFFPIGLCMKLERHSKIMPSLIGNDAGCGVSYIKFKTKKGLDFDKLDVVIRDYIPTGFNNFNDPNIDNSDYKEFESKYWNFDKLTMNIDINRANCGFGTLGSGNHFIEIGKSKTNDYYLFIHCGSRNLGDQILNGWLEKCRGSSEVYELGYTENTSSYIDDIIIATEFAQYSRQNIINNILNKMKWKADSDIVSIPHNYIEEYKKSFIIHKGSIGYNRDKIVPVSINQLDGIMMTKSIENNYLNSLPHGSGRSMPKSDIETKITTNKIRKTMDKYKIHNNITKNNLSESYAGYRSIETTRYLIDLFHLGIIKDIITPLYNFKPIN